MISPTDELTLSAYVSTTMATSDAAPATPEANFMASAVSSPSNLVYSSKRVSFFQSSGRWVGMEGGVGTQPSETAQG